MFISCSKKHHAGSLFSQVGLAVLLLTIVSWGACLAGVVSGTVTLNGGGPIAGVTVRTEGEPSYSTISAADGAYSLLLPDGMFTVLAGGSGYNPQRMPVPSGAGTVNFAMHYADSGSVTLPAPLAWGEPPSAPTPPGDSYAIAFADAGALPVPGAPRIAEYNDCVKPDESFTISGANFTTRTGADAGSDTTVWVWARTSSTQGTLRQAKVWKVSAGTIVATLPDDIPFGMYLVWVENSVGVSAPICLNRTKALWVGPIDNKVSAGGTKRVFGRNLSYGHGTSTAYVYIQPASGGTLTQCTVTSVEPYAVAFTVPAGTANGDYKVYVHNGHGWVYGWGDGLDLVVQSQWVRGTGQINVTSNGVDDTSQIQSAINTVAGYANGGTVQLGSGNYILKSQLHIAGNVQLKGAGMNSTALLLEATPNGTEGAPSGVYPTRIDPAITIAGDNAAVSDLTIHEVYGYALHTSQLYSDAYYSGLVLSNIRISFDEGSDSWKNFKATTNLGCGAEVSGCEMYRAMYAQWNCWVHDNNLYGDAGTWANQYSDGAEAPCEIFGWNQVFENNHAETLNWPSSLYYHWTDYKYKCWAKRLVLGYCSASYIAHNTTTNVGVNDNKGELILFHGHWSNWCGQVLSNNGLTMTLRTDGKVFDQPYTVSNPYGLNALTAGSSPIPDAWDYWALDVGTRQVIIIAGTGAGQVRTVAGNGVSSSTSQITVDNPWAVEPDETSVILLGGTWMNNAIYDNDMSAFPVGYSLDASHDYAAAGYASTGVQLDGNAFHTAIEGNISRRTNYGRGILGLSAGPSLWNDLRDEQAIDAYSSGFRIQEQYEPTNPLGPTLFGNAIHNCSGNVLSTASGIFGATGQGEGAVVEDVTVTSGLGYLLQTRNNGSATLYRNGSMTSNLSPYTPVAVGTAFGDALLAGNTYPGYSAPYSINPGTYGLGIASYSQLTPLYRVVRFATNYGGGALSAVLVPIANTGIADMTWSVTSSAPWITASIDAHGTVSPEGTNGSLSIAADSTGMTVGRHWGYVTVQTITGDAYPTTLSVRIGVVVDVSSSSQVAAPTFSPPVDVAGTHDVTIATATAGATIRFTTNGSNPTSGTGTVYSGRLAIQEGTVLKAIAYKNGMSDSQVSSVAVAAPTFSLPSGEYAGPHSVTISTITSGATIRYTTDGTFPSQGAGTVYTGPVQLGSSCLLRAVAYKTGMADSDVVGAQYSIDHHSWSLAGDFSSTTQGHSGWFLGTENYMKWTQPTYMAMFDSPASMYSGYSSVMQCSPDVIMWGGWGGGICYSPQSTTLSKYPMSGTYPFAAGKIGFNAGSNNYFNTKARWVASADGDYTYNVTFSRPANATNGVYVNRGDLWTGTLTQLGTETFLSDQVTSATYSGTEHLSRGQFLDFVLDTQDSTNTNTYWDNYKLCLVQVDATITCGSGNGDIVLVPALTPAPGTYTGTQSVTMSTLTSGASIKYTTDGTTPTSSHGTLYTGAASIDQTCTLKAIAYKSGMTDSSVVSGTYTIVASCATPTFAPGAGTFSSVQSVAISTTTNGATIRYTIDGTTPTPTHGTVYSSAVSVGQNCTLKAIAYKSGMNDSTVGSAAYTIACGAPTFTPAGGTFTGSQPVTISSSTGGATICYTTDGTTPTPSHGTIYGSAVPLALNRTLKAMAYKANMIDSSVTSDNYTINVATPTLSPVSGCYASAQTVTISCSTGGATVRYTTDGTDPTGSSAVYSGAISVNATTTVKAKGFKTGMADSSVGSATYVLSANVWNLASDFSSTGQGNRGWYYMDYWGNQISGPTTLWGGTGFQTDSLPDTDVALVMWGGWPRGIFKTTAATRVWKYPMSFNASQVLGTMPAGVIGFMVGNNANQDTMAKWVAPAEGDYTYYVTFRAAVPGATNGVFVVSNGSVIGTEQYFSSTNTSYTYNGTRHLLQGEYLAFVQDVYDSSSSVVFFQSQCPITLVDVSIADISTQSVAAPTFSPAAGTYSSAQSVTITTTTNGATIKYTTDGSTPSQSVGTVYSSAVSISSTCTLKAMAYKSGMSDSIVASGSYTITQTCAAPTFNPAAGTYSSAQSVSISSTTSGATIKYTTDGTTPSQSVGTVYSSAVSIAQNATLKAMAYKSGMADSTVMSGDYYIKCAAPSFSPAAGTYSSAQSVTISSTTSGASIRYTTDGTTPTSGSGTLYSSAVSISSSRTLKAIAYKSGMTDSDVTTGAYTIGTGASWNAYSGWTDRWNSGSNSPWSFMLSTQDTSGSWVSASLSNSYYGYQDTVPWNYTLYQYAGHGWSEAYWSPAIFKNATGSDTTVGPKMWKSEGDWGDSESVYMPAGTIALGANGSYITQNKAAIRWTAPADGSYSVTAAFTGACTTGTSAGVRMDLAGTTQWSDTITSYQQVKTYTGNLTMTTGQTLDAVVTGQDYVLLNYTITQGSAAVDPPTFNPAAGTYSSAQSVTISTTTSGATIRYTTDGTAPSDVAGTVYSSTVSIGQNTTLKAIAYKSGMSNSSVTSGAFNIQVASPTFSPTAGTYTGTQSVTISSTTSGATIRYTTDGTTPTSTTGTVYSSAVSVPQNLTLKAIAYKSGMTDSTVTSGAYTIACVAPTFNPAAGTYSSAQSVTISTTTSGATIRYTTDGTTPSDTSGTVYSSAVSIGSSCTLKAIAYKTNMSNSTVTSGAYTINYPCAAPTFSPAAGTYTGVQSVTISTTTNGATIRYTTDGTTPTDTAGTVYSGAVSLIKQSTTLKAIAYKSGLDNSSVTSGAYTINAGGQSWDAASTYVNSNRYTNPNGVWNFMGATADSSGALGTAGSNIWAGYDGNGYGWTVYAYQGHGWSESYWSPRVVANCGANAATYSCQIWTSEGDYGHTESVYVPAGKMVVGANSSFVTSNEVAARWTAPSSGTYRVTLSFTGACTTGTSATVAFSLGGTQQWSDSITSYQQVKSYTDTFTVSSGQTFDAVVTGRDYVMMDYSVQAL